MWKAEERALPRCQFSWVCGWSDRFRGAFPSYNAEIKQRKIRQNKLGRIKLGRVKLDRAKLVWVKLGRVKLGRVN